VSLARTAHRIASAALLAAVGCVIGAAQPSDTTRSRTRLQQLDRSLQLGVRVSVKADLLADGKLVVDQVELETSGDTDEEFRGAIADLDPQNLTFTLAGRTVRVRTKTEVTREPDRPARFEDLRDGMRVKVEGDPDDQGRLKADEIRIYQDQVRRRRVKIEGAIEALEPSTVGLATMRVAGVEVVLTLASALVDPRGRERPIAPRLGGVVDDDELLFIRDTRLGRDVAMAGEVRLRAEHIDQGEDGRETVPEITAQLGFVARLGPASAYLTLVGSREFEIRSDDPTKRRESVARIGEAYFQLPLAPRTTVAVGRQRFNDEREWYFNSRNLDAVRLFSTLPPVRLEASISRNLFDNSRNLREQDLTNLILQATYRVVRDVDLEAYFIDRDDRTPLDDSPRTYGFRLLGDPGRHLEFWVDVARQTGTYCSALRTLEVDGGFVLRDTGRRCSRIDNPEGFNARGVRAHAFDLGLTYRPRLRLDPTFTVGYALASGEDDTIRDLEVDGAEDRTATSFRQTGIHRNRWKFNGVVSFRYYGEVLDPELFNIRVWTLGAGLRLARGISIDLIHHAYRQDEASRSFHELEIDATPSGQDPDLGYGWDLALGYEPSRRFEVRLTGGVLRPGAALSSVSSLAAARFQAKFRF
jgi:hypothetical protein